MADLATSFRMYEATPQVAAAWRALFGEIFRDAGLEVQVLEHRFPKPIDELWREPGLCGAFMCGWPFVRSQRGMQAIAAPVPSLPRYGGQPRYCSEFLVRADSGWRAIEDSFGHRIGWMSSDSQSGFNAPRAFLAGFAGAQRPSLYAESKGPLGTPAMTLHALRAREVDVVAVDSFFLDLCRRHEPALLAGMRSVAQTPWTPIPLLVAAPGVDPAIVAALRERLLCAHEQPACVALLAELLLERFVAPELDAYGQLEDMARAAEQAGYAAIR